ncbi:50S ribosomal protein L24 [Candidatus Pacearchaeota archaeon]|nr:50S ribosomal protein L24 [Candidatus Pacearchaeota archaeon]
MNQEFNTGWKSSIRAGKQRKYAANAPLHIKREFMSINLSKDLRKKNKKRSIPVRKGDTVKVMRGKFKKKQGKVTKVNAKRQKVMIEGIQVKKMDGSKVDIAFRPSNLQMIELYSEDKKRGIEPVNAEPKKQEEKTAVNLAKIKKQDKHGGKK